MGGRMKGLMEGGWMDGWRDEGMDGGMYGWMKAWRDEWILITTSVFCPRRVEGSPRRRPLDRSLGSVIFCRSSERIR